MDNFTVLNNQSNKITNLGTPTNSGDAVSLGYITNTLLNYSLNTYNSETITAQKNLSLSDAKYQFLASAVDRVVNLPSPNLANQKEFILINTGTTVLEIRENNNVLDLFLNPNGRAICYSRGSSWDIFIDVQFIGTLNETSTIDGGVF